MSTDLGGKVILVTGASRGIGAAAARVLAAANAVVAINYHRSESEAAALAREIGERAFTVRADVGDPSDVAKMIDAVEQRCGRLDVLVNNAATFEMNPFDGESYEHWQAAWHRTFAL